MASYTRGVGVVWLSRTGSLLGYANRPTNDKQPSAYISVNATSSAVVTADSDSTQSGSYAVLNSYTIGDTTSTRYWHAVESNVWEFQGWKASGSSSTTSYSSTANPYSYGGKANHTRYAYFKFIGYYTINKPVSGSVQ